MKLKEITDEKYRAQWNKLTKHPLQSWEWGEFRAKTGVTTVRYGIFDPSAGSGPSALIEPIQVTIHPIPHTPWTVGYYPKGNKLTKEQVKVLAEIAKKYHCVYIKCEPKVEQYTVGSKQYADKLRKMGFAAGRPLFTKYNFVLDARKSEEELLAAMKQKTRYNIRVAEKRGVTVAIDNSEKAFEKYLALTEETTKRQGFYAHGRAYHKKMWETLHPAGIAQLLTAKYNSEIITTWVLFKFGDTLYYPYGASTREHREVMANNLVMWEAIKLAKKWKLKYLDMWGALGPEPEPKDPWYGFHTFKAGYGARQVEYIGTWDYVAQPILYPVYRIAETIRWKTLRLKTVFSRN